jgi:sugar lactone lactonase YvrE
MHSDKRRQIVHRAPGPSAGAPLRLLVLPLVVAALLAFFATPAFAGQTHALKTTFGAFSGPSGIAIDEANGNVFVADRDFSPNDSVEIFGPEGGAPSGVAVTKIEGLDFGTTGLPNGLAIDNSATSPSKGALYVADVENDTVKKFNLEGGEYKLVGELTPAPTEPALEQPLGVAVDAKGNVFVADLAFHGTPSVVEFSPDTGAEIARFDTGSTMDEPSALAVDSTGSLFVQSRDGRGVWRFAANGSGEIEPGTTPVQIRAGSPTGLAVDQATDTLYVAEKTHVDQYSASCVLQCTPEFEFGAGVLDSTERVAVAPNGDIYVVDRGEGNVAVFAAAESIAPDALTDPPSAVKQTSATLNGTVSAAAGPPASCEFQYATEASFKAEGFKGASTVPCSPAGPFTGNTPEVVKADISGLSGETNYVFRLRAFNENGPDFGEALSLSTIGKAKIKASFIAKVSLDSATVEGAINPNGGPNAAVETTYFVEYVSGKDFDESGYANATKLPAGGQGIGSGTNDVKVAQQLSGLSPGTTYHSRIVAENEAAPVEGPDMIITTFLEVVSGLPDGRAYEQATPVDKGGASAQGVIDFVKAASGGGGIAFFSNGGIPGGEGAQQFPPYLSSRAADGSGWSTQGVLPPASNGSSALLRGYSEDLSQAYAVQSKFPDEPQTFYQRDSASHALRAIASDVKSFQTFNSYAGESADGSKVLVELVYGQAAPAGAVEGQNAFVWEKSTGTLSLVGVLNGGQAPAQGSSAGSVVSGGSNYTSYEHPISADGSRAFFSSIGTRQVYVRLNPSQPQSPLEGKKCADAELACTVQISASKRTTAPLKDEKPSTLWFATPDGSEAFFTSPGKLTDNATTGPTGGGSDLYRYDVASGGLSDLTPDSTDPNGAEVQGVLGISKDGSNIYFVANGVLASNQGADGSQATLGDCANESVFPGFNEYTEGDCNLYHWHDGTITYVARQHATGPSFGTDAWNWVRKASIYQGEKTAWVSTDGQTLLFQAQEKLTSYDNQGLAEFYRYSAEDGALRCVTCNPTGAAPVASATPRSIKVALSSGIRPAAVQTRSMSADGKRFFFETPDKLVASDTNGDGGCPFEINAGAALRTPSCQDVYEWEAKGTGSCHSEDQNGGCLYLISSGTSPTPSYFADAGANGDDAFFFTLQSLVGQDKDEIVDIYDARVGGGIASQNPPSKPEPCPGETSCRGPVPTPPATQSPATPHFVGPGNQKPSHHKRKKRHHKKKHHKKRHAAKRNG